MRALCALALGFGLTLSISARAESAKPEVVLKEAARSVERGAFDEAVDRLELLADQGFVHPDASAARAYAYIERARSRAARPGDLGRAAAALEEAHQLDPADEEAEAALDVVRAEISRRRSREGGSPLIQRPTLGRAIAGLLPENAWAVLGALGSVLLTAGLLLKQAVQRRGAEIAGAVGIAAGLLFASIGGSLAAAARHYRTSSRPAVVVVPEARLLDDAGRPLPPRGALAGGIPEGALVYVREQRSDRARVEWGGAEAWIQSAQLRLIATSPEPLP